MPQISAIVPAHNAEDHLEACLEAIAGSDMQRSEFEIIVVDDASSDGTASIASAADRVITLGDTARGPAAARNAGARAARGEYLVFVDADVVLHSDALRRMAAHLDADPAVTAVFGSYDDDPHDGGLVSRYRNLLHHFAHHQIAGRVETFWSGCGIVRAAAFASIAGFDECRYAAPQVEDIEFGYRLNRQGTILLDPSIQCTHRKRWSLASVIRTDFRDRAVPWVRLLMSRVNPGGGAAPSLGIAALVGSGSASAAVVAALLAVFLGSGSWAIVAAGFAVSFLLAGAPFYWFLFRTGGVTLAIAGCVLHFIYQLESAIAVPVGVFLYLTRDCRETSPASAGSVAWSRFLHLASGEAGARLIAFVTTAYLARTLGASGFGVIGFALAVVAHFGTALSTGIGEVGARDVARDPQATRSIVSTATTLRLLIAAAAIVSIVAISSALKIDPLTREVTWLCALTVIPLALDTGWAYKGLGRTRPVGALMLVGQAVVLGLMVLAVRSDADLRRVPLVQVAGALTAALLLLVPLMHGGWVASSVSTVADLARRTRNITVSRVLRTIVVSFDVVLLGVMVTTREVGLYSAAYRIIFFVMAILYAAHVAYMPEVARSETEAAVLSRMLSESTGLALGVTVPFVVGGVLIAPSLLTSVFGAEFAAGALAFQLLLSALLLFAIHGGTRTVFIAVEKLRLETIVVAAGVVVNIAANLLLIPRYGIAGAATATIAGEAVILIGLLSVLGRLGISIHYAPSLPPILSGAAMGLALFLFGVDRPVWQTISLGAVAYVIVLGTLTLLMRRRPASLVLEMR